MIEASTIVDEICLLADKRESRFDEIISRTNPRLGMMWYSEVFILSLLCEINDCSTIVESGRYQGFSTEILANYFKETDINIISVELQKSTREAAIAEQKLSNYESVELKYGDSQKILPTIVNESSGVLIDGPKGDDALTLTIELLEETEVPFVAVHDLHKDHFYRELSEILFNDKLYTDSMSLVNRFQQYDSSYFEWHKQHSSPGDHSGPYLKHGVDSASYGPTLGIFLNGENPVDGRIRNNYLEYIKNANQQSLIGLICERLTNTFG